jgi:hypothetical protein
MYGQQELLSYLCSLNGAGLAEVDVNVLAKPGRVVISHRFRISKSCKKHVFQSVLPTCPKFGCRTQKGWQKSGQRTLNLGKFSKRFQRADNTFLEEFSKKKPVDIYVYFVLNSKRPKRAQRNTILAKLSKRGRISLGLCLILILVEG